MGEIWKLSLKMRNIVNKWYTRAIASTWFTLEYFLMFIKPFLSFFIRVGPILNYLLVQV